MNTNDTNKYKEALIKAANKIKELDLELKKAKEEKEIAIIGYNCRFPGGADNSELFWEKLSKGFDAVTEIKPDRFQADSYLSEKAEDKGKANTRYGSFLDQDIKNFDNVHFEISAVEAASVDPQQRLLMEVSWESLENAGLDIEELRGSKTGVFVGIDGVDYINREVFSGNVDDIGRYSLFGVSSHSAAGRLSYFYDFRGPAACISTACSSSLTALNMAVDSLRNGQCDLAIVGGVNLILNPEPFVGLAQNHSLSPDGRCKTFDASADGFGRGEGCGCIILKRLSDAKRDQNSIEALIKGIYVGQDGKSNGFFAPNGLAEQRVITEALKRAGLNVDDVGYIEAHGTGTPLGDLIETQSISEVFRNSKKPIKVGSVKSNIGHLEAASGMASLIKVLLSLKHKQLPPSIHFKNPNPNIDWEKIQVVDKLADWESNGKKRRAGISSYGISGTLVHLIVEEADAEEVQEEMPEMPASLLTISTKNKKALFHAVSQIRDYLSLSKEQLSDISYSTNIARDKNEYRFAVTGTSKEQILKEINHVLKNEESRKFYIGKAESKKKKIAFMFTGQGSIYKDAARELYETSKEFKETFDRCENRFQELLGVSVKETLYGKKEEKLTNALYSQPVIFSLEYSLTKVWDSLDIKPDYVIGHSVGEYAAACYIGMLSFEDATNMIAMRSRIMASVKSNGKMVGVLVDETTMREAIMESECRHVSIAAVNTSKNITVSGLSEEVDTVINVLHQKARVFVNDLGILYPYHSAVMKEYTESYGKSLNHIVCSKPAIKMISSVTGGLEEKGVFENKRYWMEHLEKTVRFMNAMQAAEKLGVTTFIEIGGNATLCGLAAQCVQNEQAVFVPSLRKGIGDYKQFLESVKQLYLKGIKMDFQQFYKNYNTEKLVLPNYPFERKKFWKEKKIQKIISENGTKAEDVGLTNIGQLLKKQNEQLLMQKQMLDDILR
ncbi:type I polyketide synthase [Bacillus wiedmannii]|uniref:type I polyketide synthase n=1 Tax=Bacillus wiedmannii TaxID=1890302 RepID=UPI000D029D18|nr:type I polyketide synthase [Bacillus wiedmannii]PRT34001.1 beta-ketoacyl synthase [Bacillus wiedmannii]PRT45268.1 beta-ketoacyl synthase [Bacillus wiedmannii]